MMISSFLTDIDIYIKQIFRFFFTAAVRLIVNVKAFHYCEFIGRGEKGDTSFYFIDIKKEDL